MAELKKPRAPRKKKEAPATVPDAPHYEAVVELSGAGNEQPAPADSITVDQALLDDLSAVVTASMEGLDQVRAKRNISPELFVNVLAGLTTDYASTFADWTAYKADPEAYMAKLNAMVEQNQGAELEVPGDN